MVLLWLVQGSGHQTWDCGVRLRGLGLGIRGLRVLGSRFTDHVQIIVQSFRAGCQVQLIR